MNQMRHVLKRDNLYTLFALDLWLFILKYILKLRKHTLDNVDKLFYPLLDKLIRYKLPTFSSEILLFSEVTTWVSKARGCARGLANTRPPGRVKLAKAPNPRN